MLPTIPDDLAWRRLDSSETPLVQTSADDVLRVSSDALRLLAREAFRDVNFLLRPSRLAQIAGILTSPEASGGDRMVAQMALENAALAARMELPLCQDTGTATVFGWKGGGIVTPGRDAEHLEAGIRETYAAGNLRHSVMVAASTFEESNSRSNLPASIRLQAVDGGAYRFLFAAKGGGSANKTRLFQESPAMLRRDRMLPFLEAKMRALGTSACPPYRIAVAVGGLSPEETLEAAKLLSCGALDGLPDASELDGALGHSGAFRDGELERELLARTRTFGIGAQLPGRFFALDVRAVRLPRHSASLPIGLAVSCLADRQVWGRIDRTGVWLEELERHPERFLPKAGEEIGSTASGSGEPPVEVDLSQPMDRIRRSLAGLPVGTMLSLTGELVVARDLAHARIRRIIESGGTPPREFFEHPIYYAGPAGTPPGHPCGSFGPTTARRMDADLRFFQEHGAALVTLAKGDRGPEVRSSCRDNGGFYLGTVGGTAALVADRCITSSRVAAFPELGMEAVFLIHVRRLPAFVIVNDRGDDLYGGC